MHATIIMPAQDIRMEATYKRIPIWNASLANLFGRDVYSYFLEKNDKGVILFFHGSGGDARDWSSLGAERRHFFDDVIAAGYAIIAIDSTDRVNKQWDLCVPPASNLDLEAVKMILESFRGNRQLPVNIPIYGVGISRGGRFASLAAYVLGMNATAIWVGLAHEGIIKITSAPTIWCLADHDPIIDRQEVSSQYQQLCDREIDARLYVNSPTPLYPMYFVNIEGIDSADSAQLF